MTKEQYIAGLDWLIKVAPNHALKAALSKGYSDINIIYLTHSLDKLPKRKEDTPPPARDPVLVLLQREKSDLFAGRAKWSNKLHDCANDAERANVSDEIQAIQRKIGSVNIRILEYKATGVLSDEKNTIADQLPDNGVELTQLRNSKRSSISYAKRKLVFLVKLADDHPDKPQIAQYEQKIKELERERDTIQAKIDQVAV